MKTPLTYVFFTLLSALSLSPITAKRNHHASLLEVLKKQDLKYAIPKGDGGKAANVEFAIVLLNIGDADPIKKEVEIDAWLILRWNIGSVWDKYKFNDIESIAVPSSYIWMPDISVFNGINELSNSAPDLVLVTHDGEALWVPRVRLRVLCDLDTNKLGWNVSCVYRFGFWSTSDSVLNITISKSGEDIINLGEYFKGSRFEILGVTAERETMVYPCCPGGNYTYYDVGISFKEKNPTHVMRGCVQSVMAWH